MHQIKDTADICILPSSYIMHIHRFMEYYSNGILSYKIYGKHDELSFPVIDFPFLSSNNICPVYGSSYVSWYTIIWACPNYQILLKMAYNCQTNYLLKDIYYWIKHIASSFNVLWSSSWFYRLLRNILSSHA